MRNDIPVYKVKDYAGEDIRGTFYQPELQRVDLNSKKSFKIEKVLKKRGRGKNEEFLIRWKNWPKKYDSWVKSSEIEEL